MEEKIDVRGSATKKGTQSRYEMEKKLLDTIKKYREGFMEGDVRKPGIVEFINTSDKNKKINRLEIMKV